MYWKTNQNDSNDLNDNIIIDDLDNVDDLDNSFYIAYEQLKYNILDEIESILLDSMKYSSFCISSENFHVRKTISSDGYKGELKDENILVIKNEKTIIVFLIIKEQYHYNNASKDYFTNSLNEIIDYINEYKDLEIKVKGKQFIIDKIEETIESIKNHKLLIENATRIKSARN